MGFEKSKVSIFIKLKYVQLGLKQLGFGKLVKRSPLAIAKNER